MKFEKIVNVFFKQQPIAKQLKSTNVLTNTLTLPFLHQSLKLYEKLIESNEEENIIKVLLKSLEQKGMVQKKTKILTFWIEMFKVTKYDLSDILLNKKLKIFTKSTMLKESLKSTITKENLDDHILVEVLVPLYNYFMKLSMNEDLFRHCVIGKIPEDEVFRRGTKIRFIWIFKLYNLINLLLPIVTNCQQILAKFPSLVALQEIALQFYQDILTMNSFVIQAIEEGADDNFLLMPYIDLLQFYESLSEQQTMEKKVHTLYDQFVKMGGELDKMEPPKKLQIDPEIKVDIETQAIRVKFISVSIKNPRKDHTRLETQYNQRLEEEKNERALKTEGNLSPKQASKLYQQFNRKYQNLD